MTVVSSREFISNQDKYFELALNEQVFVKKGENMFVVTRSDINHHEDIIFQPDDDFYRSITMEEVRDKLHRVLDKLYAQK